MDEKRVVFPKVPLYYSVPLLTICLVAFFILFFLFRIDFSEVLLQPSAMSVVNVSSCGELNRSNTYYVLNQSIVYRGAPEGRCIVITSYNSVFDGQFKSFLDESTPVYSNIIPITIYGSNITVTRMNISDMGKGMILQGIYNDGRENEISNNYIYNSLHAIFNFGRVFSPTKSKIYNNYIYNASRVGIFISGDSSSQRITNDFIHGNKIYNSEIGIFVIGAERNQISDNFIEGVYKSRNYGAENFSFDNIGIYLRYSDNNFMSNNTIKDVYNSVILFVSRFSFLHNISIEGPVLSGIFGVDSEPFTLSDSVILDSKRNGIISNVGTGWYSFINFSNVKVINGNSSYIDFYIYDSFIQGNKENTTINLVDSSFSTYKISNVSMSVSNSLVGKLKYDGVLDVSGNDFNSDIKITNNNVAVDSNLRPGLNKSATITFFGIPSNVANLVVLRNGVPCSQNICSNITFINSSTVTFNVTHWTNYSLNYTLAVPPILIYKPIENEQYSNPDSFPVIFNVSLNSNGTVKFSLNNGSTNTTMVTTDNKTFTYSQGLLSIGNYTFTAYANFSNGTKIDRSHNFRVVGIVQTLTIEEPDEGDRYTTASFPRSFEVVLNSNGAVKFSLNNGVTNITMNTTNNREFNYIQNSLSVGNYTFTAYANFSNGTLMSKFVKFSVVNTPSGSGSGSGGSGSGGSGSGSSGGTGNFTGSGSGGSGSGGSVSGSGSGSGGELDERKGEFKITLKITIYLLIVVIMFAGIIVLIILIVKSLREKIGEKSNKTFDISSKRYSGQLMSNLR